jgi:C4-dicarboxylate-specific signal transduction histidine kinase
MINGTVLHFLNQSIKAEELNILANAELKEQREELSTQNEELLKQRKVLSEKNSELETLLKQLKTAQSHLIHSEKMASLGTLTSGVAHEINNPLNFISTTLQKLEALFNELKDPSISENTRSLLINSCIKTLPGGTLGVERIARIVRSLVSFSDVSESYENDVHKIIDSTLLIIGFNIPQTIQVIKNYTKNIPKLHIQQDKLHQIILSIINNAVNAINTKQKLTHEKIIISTYTEEFNSLCISIANTGPKIPSDELIKLFDPFFTTNQSKKSVGLGLTISYNNIQALNGKIIAINNNNNMVEFIIKLPINNPNLTL